MVRLGWRSFIPTKILIYPGAERLDISSYIEDHNLQTLREVFQKSRDQAIFFLANHPSSQELDVILEAMIDNPRFTYTCLQADVQNFIRAFERAGYAMDCFRSQKLLSPSTQKEVYCFLFREERKAA